MKTRSIPRTTGAALIAALVLVSCDARVEVEPERGEKIPVTTRSDEARELFLEGRDLADKIRQAEAREYFEKAVQKDTSFALAYLALANTARSAIEFFDGLERAVELAEGVSEGERLLILAQDAGSRGDPASQRQYLTRLVEIHPRDERAHFALAAYYFGRQSFDRAIEAYREATEIEPAFSPAYNLLGYAYRSVGRFDEAEASFERYIALITGEPNPYDSFAELLMKIGRFEESIANYEKALEIDPEFVPSYIGIGNNQIFLGRTGEARKSFDRLLEVARNDGERRQAMFWIAASHIHDGDHEAAEAAARRMLAVAEAAGDWAQVSGDLALIGGIRLDTGDSDGALAAYGEALEALEKADVNADVKEAFRRNQLYREARAALGREDLDAAGRLADAYAEAVSERNIPGEVWRVRELQGLLALATDDPAAAVEHLSQANQQDPRVLYELALASRAAGDLDRAREAARTAAEWNQLGINYAYVRNAARRLTQELS